MARSCFFLVKGMADGSLGKEIPLKSISDGVVFCHPIIPKGAPFYPKEQGRCPAARDALFLATGRRQVGGR